MTPELDALTTPECDAPAVPPWSGEIIRYHLALTDMPHGDVLHVALQYRRPTEAEFTAVRDVTPCGKPYTALATSVGRVNRWCEACLAIWQRERGEE